MTFFTWHLTCKVKFIIKARGTGYPSFLHFKPFIKKTVKNSTQHKNNNKKTQYRILPTTVDSEAVEAVNFFACDPPDREGTTPAVATTAGPACVVRGGGGPRYLPRPERLTPPPPRLAPARATYASEVALAMLRQHAC